MKAITLWQPYASLVAIKAKPFETRAYPPPAKLIGERIAIHAGRNPIAGQRALIAAENFQAFHAIEAALSDAGFTGWADLPLGAVVCTAVLAGAYRVDGDGSAPVGGIVPVTPHCASKPMLRKIAIDPPRRLLPRPLGMAAHRRAAARPARAGQGQAGVVGVG